jgi:hypothetical protein
MEHVSDDRPIMGDERPFVGYAQPLSRLQVSWGSILAGAVTTLAVSILLWALSLAIVLTATNATMGSLRGSMIALSILAIITTLIGGFVGGAVAGYLPGNPRRIISATHGFLSWGVAFLVAVMFQLAFVQFVARTTTSAVVQTAGAAAQTVGRPTDLATRAQTLLETLGYTRSQAAAMVGETKADLQRGIRQNTTGAAAANQARDAAQSVISGGALYTWLWFGTWFVAGALSMLGASAVVSRVRRVPSRERAFIRSDVDYPPIGARHIPVRP